MKQNAATVKVNAKLNLSLLITGRSGGFHTLDTVMASIDSVYDTVTASVRDDAAVVFCCNVPLPEENTAVQAARAFTAAFHTPGVSLRIAKNIPVEAGLGGSSADAAGVLNAMQHLFGKQNRAEVEKIARSVGSDVPYMLYGGFARVSSTGEKLEFFRAKRNLYLLVAKPEGGVGTAEAFRLYDETERTKLCGDNAALVNLLRCGETERIAPLLVNDLYPCSCALNKNVARLKERLQNTGALAVCMTGSGSALYGVYPNRAASERAKVAVENCAAYCIVGKTFNHKGE